MPSTTPPGGLPLWVAHTPPKNDRKRWHGLADHILGVTERAVGFAEPFGGAALARYVGLLHDLGKFTVKFQEYLILCYLADKGKAIRPEKGSAPHKHHGARAALDDLRGWDREGAKLIAALIHGHHGGMRDRDTALNNVNEKDKGATSQAVAELRRLARAVHPALDPPVPDAAVLVPPPHNAGPLDQEMFLRFVFSCLVDADWLDTEAHGNQDAATLRQSVAPPSLADLRDQLMERQTADFADAEPTTVNTVRREVYASCRRAAVEHEPGVFSLTVPTGGGKTRSSLAFALEHAAHHGLRRVVYAIPYTSIVDQTASEFLKMFGGGSRVVLEHHSAIEPRVKRGDDEPVGDTEKKWRRLAAENWDAPLVVTTMVQLFESLFSNRTSACRKLHRLAGSVIVLDEVQTLPPTLLEPIRSGLKALVTNYGASVVLCSATMPALDTQSPFQSGFDPAPTPIVADPKPHFEALRRVRYRVVAEPWDWQEVADEMRAGGGSCLCVVNTRQQALDLLDVLDKERSDLNVLHLSTLMCGRHRRDVLAEVRSRLIDGPPVLVVSTQLIEAGVDIDFPRVLRAVGPLDRIIQAAGRCNREGKRARDDSQVIVFTPQDDAAPRGIYRMALDRTVALFRSDAAAMDLDDPELVTDYFRRLYGDLFGDVDKKKVQEDRRNFRYPEVAASVRLIEEDTISVLVTGYKLAAGEAQAILEEADRIGRMTRDLWRRAQPHCVNVYRDAVDAGKAPVMERADGLRVWLGDYDARTGIPLAREMADAIVYKPSSLVA